MKTNQELKCIIVYKFHNGVLEEINRIDFNTFKQSYIDERWRGERRTERKNTIFGNVHTKTTVNNNDLHLKFVTEFDFPKSLEEAKQLDEEYEGSR